MSSLYENEAEVDDGDDTDEEIQPENADDRAFIYDGDAKSCSGMCRVVLLSFADASVYEAVVWFDVTTWVLSCLYVFPNSRCVEGGTEDISVRCFMDFEEARAAVRRLKIRDEDGWIQCFDAGEVGAQIPRDPEKWYCRHGWVSWDDWLGGSRYLSFVDAREEVRKKRFKSKDVFRKWAGSSMQRRGGIPADEGLVHTFRPLKKNNTSVAELQLH